MNYVLLKWIKLSVLTGLFFFSLDLFWNGFVIRSFFMKELGTLLRLSSAGFFTPLLPAAIIAWITVVVGIIFFVYPLVLGASTWHWPALLGGLYGFVLFTVYECTNLAILAHWSVFFSLIDIAWGICVCSLTTVFGWMIGL